MESAAGIGASRADNLRVEKRKQQKREGNARTVLKRKAQAVTFAEREWGQHLGRLYEQMHDAAVPRDPAAERQWQQQLLMAQQRYLQIHHAQRQLQQQFQQLPPIATVYMHTPSSSSPLSPSQPPPPQPPPPPPPPSPLVDVMSQRLTAKHARACRVITRGLDAVVRPKTPAF